MLMCTTWKTRPLSPDAANRMMEIWGKIEADIAERSDTRRLCWYMYADGSGGFTVAESDDGDDATFGLETTLALGEFLEFETRPVFDMESAMPAIMNAMGRANG